MTAPIVRDPTDACSLDNRGQMVWAYLPPPPLRRANRMRRVALRRVAIMAAVAVLLAMLALVAVALTADAASDQPGRPTWVCRWRLKRLNPVMSWKYECKRVVVR